MIKNFSKLSIILLLITATGCEGWLDNRPEGQIVLEDYWQDESQVNQVLASCYRSLTERDVIERMLVWGELRSDNVVEGSEMHEPMEQILNVDITPGNEYCHWGAFYRTINYCNNFLHYAPDVLDTDPNFTESKLNAMRAEVLTIRALSYFYLVRTFKEVPWISDPGIDDTQEYKIPKSTEEEVLNNIIADLNTALTMAREKFDKEAYKTGRITRNTIYALLADIYLWMENYQGCIEACDQVLQSSDLELVDGEDVLTEVFYSGNASETIFELQFDDDTQYNWALVDLYGGSGTFAGQWSFPYVLLDGEDRIFDMDFGNRKESAEDLREKDFINFNSGIKGFVFKYAGASRQENQVTGNSSYFYRSNTANWIIYRLSDIMLMKAEAIIQLDQDYQGAFDLINTVYMRSNPEEAISGGLSFANYNSKRELENLLLRERQRELMFEGKRWFDLMRLARRANSPDPLLGYVLQKVGSGGGGGEASKMSVMNALYLPIHKDELKTNTALVQNEYYQSIAEGTNN